MPRLSERRYRLRVESHHEGDAVFSIAFHNSDGSGDVVHYDCSFQIIQPDVRPDFRLDAAVRSEHATTIQIFNPLQRDVLVRIEAPEEIKIPRQQVLTGDSIHELCLRYRPLLEEEKSASLTVSSDDLAPWRYDLFLKARRALPESPLRFETCLGDSQRHVLTLRNEAIAGTEYRCRVEGDVTRAFLCDTCVVAEGPSFDVSLIYEPTECGSCQEAQLLVASDVGGVYEVPLLGSCTAPQPRGPIRVIPSASLSFKNVFSDKTAFICTVDNPCFTVTSVGELPSKGTQQIEIKCSKEKEKGILLIKGHLYQWVYYLQS